MSGNGFRYILLIIFSLSSTLHASIFARIELRYEEALKKMLESSILLKISELEVEANEAEERMHGWPNPELSIEFENPNELTCTVTQVFELGGKCKSEREMKRVATIESMWDLEINKLDLILEFTHDFIDAYTWQEKFLLAEKELNLTVESGDCVNEKIREGKTPAYDKNKQDVYCLQKQMNLAKVKNQYEIAKRKLSLLCGKLDIEFDRLIYPFFEIAPLPPLNVLQDQLKTTPEWSKYEISCIAAASVARLEKKQSYPNLEVSAGYSSGDEENSFFVEFSLPLPLFDRNQGNIAKAVIKESQAYYLKQQRQMDLESRLQASYLSWKSAYENAKDVQTLVNVSTSTSVQTIEEGFAQGKYEKSDVLEAQTASLEIQEQFVEALADYHHKKAETLRLIGQL